ncbi:hypothetical protein AADG64_15400 [Achromobacter xylosoxidans]|uniref:hypothetical protein n=2 Tax=Alcaligenes xylosoxydans xylosoxydans TaxID=85698 RepID=UPI00336ACECF
MITSTAPTMEALAALYEANRRQPVRAAMRIPDSQELADEVAATAARTGCLLTLRRGPPLTDCRTG